MDGARVCPGVTGRGAARPTTESGGPVIVVLSAGLVPDAAMVNPASLTHRAHDLLNRGAAGRIPGRSILTGGTKPTWRAREDEPA